MNRELKQVTAIGASAIFLTAIPVLAQTGAATGDAPAARESNGAVVTPETKPPASAMKPGTVFITADEHFVTTAALAGMAEVEMGKLAAANASSSEVKQFAQQMVMDHTKANATLAGIVAGKGGTVPAGLSPNDAATMKRLQGLQGAAFDREYLKVQQAAHQDAVVLFRNEAQGGSDRDLKTFASATLPALEAHLTMVNKLAAQRTDKMG